MPKKKPLSGPGHELTASERASGRRQADIDELMDQKLLETRDALHQYVSMVAAGIGEEAGIELPKSFLAERSKIVGEFIRYVKRELKRYPKVPRRPT
jgi:hypothetical protein